MEVLHETELVKNCLIPMSDGVVLAADLYRPIVDHPVPALVSFGPYQKDGAYGANYEELMRGMAQAGYGCLAVDVRGTGGSGGSTVFTKGKRERRDYYEVVEWAASEDWCDGKVGVWGKSYGGAATYFTAAENPPHLAAAAVFHAGGKLWIDGMWITAGRFRLMQAIAEWGPEMACWNSMPPGYRDAEGRWLAVWREHLESNVPWMITALDLAHSGKVEYEPHRVMFDRIRVPVYIFSGWRDPFPKEALEAYRLLKVPKKLTVGPWMHVLPDVGHAGRIDYLHELRRWFDYWLKGEDTQIMDEPAVSFWVQETDTWYQAEDFPPPGVEDLTLALGPEGRLSESVPAVVGGGSDSFEYDATAGPYSEVRAAQGPCLDLRPDELKGVIYTTSPLDEDMEIWGPPEVVLQYESTAPETLLAVRLCDVSPNGYSSLITEGWVDVEWARTQESTWGRAVDAGSGVHLDLVPTAYSVRAGHRLRLLVSGSNFPRSVPSRGPGQISVGWGKEPLSEVRLPIRPPGIEVGKPAFLAPREIPHPSTAPPMWRIEHNPAERTITVRTGSYRSLGIDGGEGPATVVYERESSTTASQIQPSQPSAHGEAWGSWENAHEKIEVHTVSVFRPVGIDLSVNITLNGAPYWQKKWSRVWPQDEEIS